jgi:hypothetical protein
VLATLVVTVLATPVSTALAQAAADAPAAPVDVPAEVPPTPPAEPGPVTVTALSPPTTVSFLDNRPFTISLDELEAAQGLTVAVHNDLAKKQSVSLQILGLNRASDKKVRTIFGETAVSDDAPGGGSAALELQLGATSGVAAGTYEALLVATGESGSPARLDLTITVDDSSTVPGPGRGDQLAASDVNAVTVSATNYLPSFLAPWAGALMALAALLALGFWVAAGIPLPQGLRPFLVGLAVLAAIVAATQLFQRDLSKPTSIHAISVHPLPTTGVSDGTVGVAQDGSGRLASLEVSDDFLRPQNLQSAGVYKGKIDLDSDADGGNADATINVRDWWPWAFLTLALGLGLGVWLRRWFEVERQQRRVNMRFARIRAEVGQSDVEFERQADGKFDLFMNKRLASRAAVIERLVDDEDAAKAKEKLAALESYVDDFRDLRDDVSDLLQVVARIRDDWEKHRFGLSADSSIAVVAGLTALNAERFDSPGTDDDASQLKAFKAKVDTLLAAARGVNRLQKVLLVELDSVGSCDADQAELDKLSKDLEALGQKVLREADSTKLPALVAENDALATRVLALCPEPEIEIEIEDVRRLVGLREMLRTGRIDRVLVEEAVEDVAPKPAESRVDISYWILASDGVRQEQVRPEDPLILHVGFSGAQPGYQQVSIDLGDQSPPLIRDVPTEEPRTIEIPAKYLTEGDYTVQVFGHPDPSQAPVAKEVISVAGKPRLAALTDAYYRADQTVLRAAFLVSVGSGLTALYFVAPGWGQPQDYLNAVLWGGVVGQGATVAAGLASRVLPKA